MTHDLQVLWVGKHPQTGTPLVPARDATGGRDVAIHCLLLGDGGVKPASVEATGGELWNEQDLVDRRGIAQFLVEFIASRGVDVLHLHSGRLMADLLPAICRAYPDLVVVTSARCGERGERGERAFDPFTEYLLLRYAGLICGYLAETEAVPGELLRRGVPEAVISRIPGGTGDDHDQDHERMEMLRSFYRSIAARRTPTDAPVLSTSIAADREAEDRLSTSGTWQPRSGAPRSPRTRMTRRAMSTTSARVSVVMPFYDHEEFVDEAIASIRSQTRPVDEIIVVDDGSTNPKCTEVLASLVDNGISVIRQEHRGPSAARNTGAAASSGDAIFFLDSDDVMPSNQIETALDALVAAPADVGFVYPDFEFFGNQERIVEMPPYNLYLLMRRNYCGMGCMIDSGVFDAGFEFHEDLVGIHEDWDYFLTLGAAGIHGVPNHAARLRYRHHATSRRQLFQDAGGDHESSVASVHPELFGDRSLIEVKCRWAPALSVVTTSPPPIDVAHQTCGDFELLVAPDVGPMPQARGRWVVVVEPKGMGGFSDPGFIERLLRLALRNPDTAAFGLAHVPDDRLTVPWERMLGRPVAVLLGGLAYAQWRVDAHLGPDGLGPVLEDLVQPQGITEWWRSPSVRNHSTRPAPDPVDAFSTAEPSTLAPSLPPDNDPQNSEAHFRWSEAAPVFIPKGGLRRMPKPPRGYRDGAHAIAEGAWATWKPERTVRLDLVRRLDGSARLEAVDDITSSRAPSEGELRVSLGRAWTEPLSGTACLAAGTNQLTNAPVYRVTTDSTLSVRELPIAYVFNSPLDEGVELAGAFERACRSLLSQAPATSVPALEIESERALICARSSLSINLATSIGADGSDSRSAESQTWVALYEIALDGHRFRYTTEPDDCMLRTESIRPTAMAVAQVTMPGRTSPAVGLFQAAWSDGGGTWYVNGSELLHYSEQLVNARLIGDISPIPGVTSPLLRLSPGSPAVMVVGEPGQRLAIDWRSLTHSGYRVEGTIGHARAPDPGLAPLYRWSETATGRSCLTLGDRPRDGSLSWTLEGTLGMAWRPGCAVPGAGDLWEMARDGEVTYTAQPDLLEADGYRAQRVVARVLIEASPDMLPLLWARSHPTGQGFATVSAREAEVTGRVDHQVIGHIRPLSLPWRSSPEDLTSAPEMWTCVPGPDGRPASGVWVARLPIPDGVPLRTLTANPTAIEIGGQDAGGPASSFVGYASSRLVPYARPVFEVEADGGGSGNGPKGSSLTIALSPGARITGVRCYAFGRPSDHLLARHDGGAADSAAGGPADSAAGGPADSAAGGPADRAADSAGDRAAGGATARWRVRRQR
jgi:hypothetical protein